MNRRVKAVGIILLSIFSTTIVAVHYYGQLYPITQIAIPLSLVTITIAFIGQDDLRAALVLITVIMGGYFTYIFQFGASLIGTDPQWLAIWIQQLIEVGHINAIESQFYQGAPAFFIFPTVGALIGDLGAPRAMIVYPLSMALFIPSIVAAITQAYTDNYAPLIGAILSAGGTYIMMYSAVVIPQVIATIYLFCIIYGIVFYLIFPDVRYTGIVLVGLLGATISHKIILVVVLMPLILSAVLLRVVVKPDVSPRYSRLNTMIGAVGLITIGGLFIQWEILTNYTPRAIAELSQITYVLFTAPEPVYTAAEPLNAGIYPLLKFALPIIFVLSIGGFAWLSLALSEHNKPQFLVLLTICAILVATVLTSFFSPLTNSRMMFYAEGILAIVISTGIIAKHNPRRIMAVILVTLLLTAMALSPYARHDSNDGVRSYLVESEAEAKQFGEAFADTIYTDRRYAWTIPKSSIKDDSGDEVYQPFENSILNGNLSDNYTCVSYRTGSNRVHENERGTYKLTWNPLKSLDIEYNRIYSTEDTTIHCRIS